jgi:hypothetical protein
MTWELSALAACSFILRLLLRARYELPRYCKRPFLPLENGWTEKANFAILQKTTSMSLLRVVWQGRVFTLHNAGLSTASAAIGDLTLSRRVVS